MPDNITLLINGTRTTLNWTVFVANLEATPVAKHLSELLDTAFVLQCTFLVFLMQAGFLMLETGSISSKTKITGILLKNIGDATLCSFFYYLVGYGISFGKGNMFIGGSGFAAQGYPLCTEDAQGSATCSSKQYADMLYCLSFAASTATIMSGSIAERTTLSSYYLISVFLSCWIYPVVARWIWYEGGWASMYMPVEERLFGVGALDFAGSSVVHVTGSLAGLILLPLVGARKYRFDGDAKDVRLPGQNNYFNTLGTLILWMSFYGFVCGSTRGISGTLGSVVAKAACNTTIAAATASFVTLLLGLCYEKRMDSGNANNGIIAGLVGISAGAATVATESAVCIGIISAFIYFSTSRLMVRVKLDDVVDGVPVHGCCGVWGIIAAAIFSKRELVRDAFPHFTNDSEVPCGLLYTCDGLGTKLFAANLTYLLALLLWVGGFILLLAVPLWYFNLLHDEKVSERPYGIQATVLVDDFETSSSSEGPQLGTIVEASEVGSSKGGIEMSDLKLRGETDTESTVSGALEVIKEVDPDIDRLTPTPPLPPRLTSTIRLSRASSDNPASDNPASDNTNSNNDNTDFTNDNTDFTDDNTDFTGDNLTDN